MAMNLRIIFSLGLDVSTNQLLQWFIRQRQPEDDLIPDSPLA
jgi:hypothetical protein